MSTLQQHYERLRQTDREKWNKMNAALAFQGLHGSNCLVNFEGTILRKERAHPEKLDLRVIPFHIADVLVGFLGFTWDDIRANRIPDLADGGDI